MYCYNCGNKLEEADYTALIPDKEASGLFVMQNDIVKNEQQSQN